MNRQSAIYVGTVMHRRLTPRVHKFRYRLFWLLLDLDELDALPARLRWFSRNRFNLFSLHDRDHGDASETPLPEQIARHLLQAGIAWSGGTIRLLCMPRMFGYSFNPLSIYFCANPEGTPAAIIYEVHNTFGERHSYVIPLGAGDDVHHSCNKAFYVSPFMDMGLRYTFSVDQPEDDLTVSIRANGSDGKPVMIACLAAKRRMLTDAVLLRLLFAMPALTLKVTAAIHWQALRLWLKGVSLKEKPPASAQFATTGQSGKMA
jgi:DUF1365 family protein